MREEILKVRRRNRRKRDANCRRRKSESVMTVMAEQHPISVDSYRTPSALSKALAKVKNAWPSSMEKRKAIVAKRFHSFDENIQMEIILKNSIINVIKADIVTAVQLFYERDDISHISRMPNECRKRICTLCTAKSIKIKTIATWIIWGNWYWWHLLLLSRRQ